MTNDPYEHNKDRVLAEAKADMFIAEGCPVGARMSLITAYLFGVARGLQKATEMLPVRKNNGD